MWRWSDIRILLVLSDLVLIQDMIYQALHAAAERIAVAIPVAQIAGEAGPVAMALDQEAVAQQEGALLDDLDDLAGVVARHALPHELLVDLPRVALLDGDDHVAGGAGAGPASQERPGEGPLRLLQLLGIGAEQRAGLVEGEGLARPVVARRRAAVAQGRRRRDPPDRTARTLQRRRLQHALVLIAQSAQAALPRELRRVVQLVDVGHATREESVF